MCNIYWDGDGKIRETYIFFLQFTVKLQRTVTHTEQWGKRAMISCSGPSKNHVTYNSKNGETCQLDVQYKPDPDFKCPCVQLAVLLKSDSGKESHFYDRN